MPSPDAHGPADSSAELSSRHAELAARMLHPDIFRQILAFVDARALPVLLRVSWATYEIAGPLLYTDLRIGCCGACQRVACSDKHARAPRHPLEDWQWPSRTAGPLLALVRTLHMSVLALRSSRIAPIDALTALRTIGLCNRGRHLLHDVLLSRRRAAPTLFVGRIVKSPFDMLNLIESLDESIQQSITHLFIFGSGEWAHLTDLLTENRSVLLPVPTACACLERPDVHCPCHAVLKALSFVHRRLYCSRSNTPYGKWRLLGLSPEAWSAQWADRLARHQLGFDGTTADQATVKSGGAAVKRVFAWGRVEMVRFSDWAAASDEWRDVMSAQELQAYIECTEGRQSVCA